MPTTVRAGWRRCSSKTRSASSGARATTAGGAGWHAPACTLRAPACTLACGQSPMQPVAGAPCGCLQLPSQRAPLPGKQLRRLDLSSPPQRGILIIPNEIFIDLHLAISLRLPPCLPSGVSLPRRRPTCGSTCLTSSARMTARRVSLRACVSSLCITWGPCQHGHTAAMAGSAPCMQARMWGAMHAPPPC